MFLFLISLALSTRVRRRHEPESNAMVAAIDISTQITGNVNEMLYAIGNALKQVLLPSRVSYSQPQGGEWLAGVQDDIVYSCYYHPTHYHRVSVKPGSSAKVFPRAPQWIEPGKFACVYTSSSRFGGNQAFYDVYQG